MTEPASQSRQAVRRIGRSVFGDRIGFALFLGTLCFTLVAWRTGIVINDNVTLQQTLAALAEGRVWIEPATGEFLRTPGTSVRDGYVYGRNYGQLVLSLPALWGLQLIDAIADLHVALTAVWHLLVLAFLVQVGKLTAHGRTLTVGGSALVLASFVGNLLLATSFDPSLSLVALQLTATVVAALAAVGMYRLIALSDGTRSGLVAGLALVVATPVMFWGLVPKRHAFSVAIAVGILYAFARSRSADSRVALPYVGAVTLYRAGAYALVGLLTWIHAEEGVYAFLALSLVDIPTAPRNDARSLAVVGAIFACSLVPFFVTNVLVSGDVLKPPRALIGGFFETTGGTGGGGGTAGGGSGGAGTGGGNGTSSGTSLLALVVSLIPSQAVWVAGNVWGSLVQGANGVLKTQNMFQTLVHSSVESINEDIGFRGINLSLLEAAPVLGGLVAGAVVATTEAVKRRFRGVDPTVILALVLAVAVILSKAGKLPLKVQITVRYFLPLYALGIFLLARSQLAAWVAEKHRTLALWSFTGGVAIGGQVLLLVVVLGQFSVGEAARLHALLGGGIGLGVAILCLAGIVDERARPLAVVTLGLGAAASTVFVLLAGLYYFAFAGEYILPVVEFVADRLAAVG